MDSEAAKRLVPEFLQVCGTCEWYYCSSSGIPSCLQHSGLEEPRAYTTCPSWILHWGIVPTEV